MMLVCLKEMSELTYTNTEKDTSSDLHCDLCETAFDYEYYSRYQKTSNMVPETDLFIPIINEYQNERVIALSQYPKKLTLCDFCKIAVYLDYSLFTEAGRQSLYDNDTEKLIDHNLRKLFKDYTDNHC